MSARNHEITIPQRLLGPDGSIAERGWSRRQLQEYSRKDIKASKFRIKEWDYYLVLGRDYGAAFTISDDGYIGLQSVSLLDFRNKWEHTETILNFLPLGKLHMPPNSSEGDVRYVDKRLNIVFHLEEGKRVLDYHFRNFYKGKEFTCHLELEQPPMDSLVIATPWKEKQNAFYYNRKINCMRASGFMEYGGKRYEFFPETDFGTLDWGRGVWTYDNTWFWGSGNSDLNGHTFGFNIGYGFGDTSAATENLLFYDGKAHKLDDIIFHIPEDDYLRPWKFTSCDGRFEMDFEPILDRAAKLDLLIISSDQHQVFGRMSGKTVLDDGKVLNVSDLLCFAEKVHNRY